MAGKKKVVSINKVGPVPTTEDLVKELDKRFTADARKVAGLSHGSDVELADILGQVWAAIKTVQTKERTRSKTFKGWVNIAKLPQSVTTLTNLRRLRTENELVWQAYQEGMKADNGLALLAYEGWGFAITKTLVRQVRNLPVREARSLLAEKSGRNSKTLSQWGDEVFSQLEAARARVQTLEAWIEAQSSMAIEGAEELPPKDKKMTRAEANKLIATYAKRKAKAKEEGKDEG